MLGDIVALGAIGRVTFFLLIGLKEVDSQLVTFFFWKGVVGQINCEPLPRERNTIQGLGFGVQQTKGPNENNSIDSLVIFGTSLHFYCAIMTLHPKTSPRWWKLLLNNELWTCEEHTIQSIVPKSCQKFLQHLWFPVLSANSVAAAAYSFPKIFWLPLH